MKPLCILYNKLVYRPIIRYRLKKSGKRFRLGYGSEIINPHYFDIGDDFFTGPHCYFVTNEWSPVTIGAKVMCGPHVKIIGGNHDTHFTGGHVAEKKTPREIREDIVIEDGVWVGAGAVILSGTRIGEGAVIGAMAVVNHYVPPYVIATGNPAKTFVRRFPSDEDLAEILRNVSSAYSVSDVRRLYATYELERHGNGP
ncbi:MAG: 2,3,4,5-tetrahydropyridine-2,6-dicarboxylate N-acetyltransferase [Gammaproteobacteria bacterium]|nr:2,3,4,5-tetrahydropyridine-2,6-dicarboxylate N-acetyltransferase [Gammaproteobacteria bacterium]